MDSVAPSQLVFPRAVDSLQADRGAIRGQLRDTYNRLHSIAHDAAFIHDEVAQAYPDFPVVGANLALLPLIKHRQGIVFVDSTRRGKVRLHPSRSATFAILTVFAFQRFPDALSKTIPLWCATLNRARVLLLPPAPDNSSVTAEEWQRQGCLYTSPQAVGRSEHAQIEEKIEVWAQDLASSAYDLSALKALDRPLRPFFVSPASTLTPSPASSFPTCYAVICASASKLAEEADGLERALGFTYVQGSGDDHEAWSKGLTPPVFWQHADEILGASREEIDGVIEQILATSSLAALNIADPASSSTPSSTQIRSTNLYLRFAASSADSAADDTTLINVGASKAPPPTDSNPLPTSLSAKPGKAGYNSFFSPAYLEPALELATDKLRQGSKVCVSVLAGEAQSEANDLGVAVALILLVSKDRIRTRLQWVLEAFPTVNPSRAVLNRVNEFAMSKRR
ncbi:hypothetical protein Rhopal_005270-T1 [Rhodotorula paludigena]|uniref:Initiator tRNA phosphoribosyl transferase n=1 Tax=Rhodotorula paludigena TaxID=86838 RepID=A0AAV5GHY5_9BASI|nr:hypothetical protein Rhopal_005270-T1 [Rhodotorula paludigena]